MAKTTSDEHDNFTVNVEPKPWEGGWEMAPTGNFDVLSIHNIAAPCWFHRKMQRFILGIKWRRVEK